MRVDNSQITVRPGASGGDSPVGRIYATPTSFSM